MKKEENARKKQVGEAERKSGHYQSTAPPLTHAWQGSQAPRKLLGLQGGEQRRVVH